jgi:two-component system sensor histidine kinase KdpD
VIVAAIVTCRQPAQQRARTRYYGLVAGRGPRRSDDGARRAYPYALAVGALLIVTLVLFALRAYLSLATVVLAYLLVVFLVALRAGRGPSLVGSVVAMLLANYFFTVPYQTLLVTSPQDIISLVVFLIVAEATSRLTIERQRLQREAAEAEILSIILSSVSHDLRTPLSSIRMAATALLQTGARWDDAARRDLLETIDSESSRLARLVGNLLDLSRIQAGALQLKKEPHEVHEVVSRAVDAVAGRIRAHHVRTDVAPDLPLVPMDFTLIEDVLVNLLDNSVRNAPEGSEIRILAHAGEHAVLIRVENDGPPIPREIAGEIFKRFVTGQHRQGTGLGLVICRGLVEAHGGRIWVERPGEPGARFVFTLPVGEALAPVGERPLVAS